MATINLSSLIKNQVSIYRDWAIFAGAFSELYSKKAAQVQNFVVNSMNQDDYDVYLSVAIEAINKTGFVHSTDITAAVNQEIEKVPVYDQNGESIIYEPTLNQLMTILSSSYQEAMGLSTVYSYLAENAKWDQSKVMSKIQAILGTIKLPTVVSSLVLSVADGQDSGSAFTQTAFTATMRKYNGFDWQDYDYDSGSIVLGVVSSIISDITAGVTAVFETVNSFSTLCKAIIDGVGTILANLLSMINPDILTDYAINSEGRDQIWSVPVASFSFSKDNVDSACSDVAGKSTVIYNYGYPQVWNADEMVAPHFRFRSANTLMLSMRNALDTLLEDSSVVTIPVGNLLVQIFHKESNDYGCEIYINSNVQSLNSESLYVANIPSSAMNKDYYDAFMHPLNYSVFGQFNVQTSMLATSSYGVVGTKAYDSGLVGRDIVFNNIPNDPTDLDYRSLSLVQNIKYKNEQFVNIPIALKAILVYAIMAGSRNWGGILGSSKTLTVGDSSVTIGSTGDVEDEVDFYPYIVTNTVNPRFHIQSFSVIVGEYKSFIYKAIAAVAAIAVGCIIAKNVKVLKKKIHQLSVDTEALKYDYINNPSPESYDAYYKSLKKERIVNKVSGLFGLGQGSSVAPLVSDLDDSSADIIDAIKGPSGFPF